jgi:sister chromatid cohesion protein PDS5
MFCFPQLPTCSAVDKAHLRLAAAKAVLRLSRQWDHKVPVDVFYLTIRISQVIFGDVAA